LVAEEEQFPADGDEELESGEGQPVNAGGKTVGE
jgi:hypothetical protein